MLRRVQIEPNEARVTTVVRGPHPLGVLTTRAVDAEVTRALQGRSARPRIGLRAGVGWAFYGDLGPLQRFSGAADFVGHGLPRRPSGTALPATQRPAGVRPDHALDLVRMIP